MYTYIFSTDDVSLTIGYIMSAAILVNTPITSPFGSNAFTTSIMPLAVVIGEVPRDKVLVGF